MLKKIDRMHKLFGKSEQYSCKDCSNFCRYRHHDRGVSKCLVYGDTRSEASDWNGNYSACGMYNRDYMGRKIIEVTSSEAEAEIPLPGQRSLFDEA